MSKGVIYIMTTAVTGLIKTGKTQTKNFQERMRFLEANGYYNTVGLRRFFAIEVEDYDDKEGLLQEVFSKHRVEESELFALDKDLVKRLLLSFEGKVVFPENVDREKEFDEVTVAKKQDALFTFYRKGIKNGDIIHFIDDDSITAKVIGDRKVEYEGQEYLLSPLTYKIYAERGHLRDSGSYQGARHWSYEGVRLTKMKDV